MGNFHNILKEALRSNDPLLAAEAARLIGEWNGKSLVPDLIENALSSRFYSKVSAIYALVALLAVEAVPGLEKLLNAPNVPDDFYWTGYKGVRAAAAVALLQFGSDAGVAYLQELAEAGDCVFSRWYAPALLRLKPVPELQPYLTLEKLCSLEERNAFDEVPYTDAGQLCMLCEALGLINDPAAVESLEFYMNFHSRYVRGQAYRSLHLRQADEATARRICANAERHGTDFERLVAAEIRQDSAILLEVARQAPLAFDRASALDALVRISSPHLAEACLVGLEDGDTHVRQCAVEGLARSKHPAARNHLAGLLDKETESRVRCAIAATMLQKEETPC